MNLLITVSIGCHRPGGVCAEFVSQQLCLPFPVRINVHGLH